LNRTPQEIPIGWYVLSPSKRLRKGQIISSTFFHEELILFRGKNGKVGLIGAYCSHMGAHLKDGKVTGDLLRCPFHGFCFNAQGKCKKTGIKGEKPPAKAVQKTYPIIEKEGLILVYYHPKGKSPDWTVCDFDMENYSPMYFKNLSLKSHPQETSENSVDFTHFDWVHGFKNPKQINKLRQEGPYLFAKYQVTREVKVFKLRLFNITFTMDIKLSGLGFSQVDTKIHKWNLKVRFFVFSTPTHKNSINLLIGCSSHLFGPRLLPRKLIASLLNRLVAYEYEKEVKQDCHIWESKKYLETPILAKSDALIGKYRSYTKQFYGQKWAKANKSDDSIMKELV
jgi:nitrite reductase/ring-hydroxylating ferredoxin subunit